MADFTLTISDERIEATVREIFLNFPEAACYSIRCAGWDYENFKFIFVDPESDPGESVVEGREPDTSVTLTDFFGSSERAAYTVELPQAIEGFKLYLAEFYAGKYHTCGVDDPLNPEVHDGDSLDIILQLTLFGDVIFG